MAYLLPHLLEEAAQVDPEKSALVCRDDVMTYGELAQRARALSILLAELGAGPGDRVGIMLPKRLESVVAVWGIMDMGGVYVPIDPATPAKRVEYIVRDCEIRHLVTEPSKIPILDELERSGVVLDSVIGLQSDSSPYPGYPWDEIGSSAEPRLRQGDISELDLAYIIYTSGSTGVPKGIMHSHRSGVWFADVSTLNYSLTDADVMSNYGGLHFDLSTLDFFAGAKARATVVMIPEENMKLAGSFADIVESARLTFLYTVPLALVQLSQPGLLHDRDMSALTRLVFGGEVMPVKHLRELMRALPGTEFVNAYGPAETNGCTHYRIPGPLPAETQSVPIGVPYPNVEYLVLDENREPVEQGAVGELVVRAPTVMNGYWRRPDLNDKVFHYRDRHSGRPDVFVNTGDLVHVDKSGDLHFHGRKDRQIKSRGYRIELDEVEAALLSHPSVEEAAAFGLKVADMTEIHSAVLLNGSGASPDSIHAHAARALPPYALPQSIEIRDELPRTTSGKIDRRALQDELAEQKGTGE